MKAGGYGWVAASIAGLSSPATAVIAWQDSAPYVLSTRGSKLASVLNELGANHGIPVIVSPQVDDAFVGTLRPMPPGRRSTCWRSSISWPGTTTDRPSMFTRRGKSTPGW
ncbi:hypothetical protein [Microvirgula aerodenitrificans]|uniref:hypothetical protein n=1 Tax=Microvirgula aerodenitrificans TaxID=57480 RepID=UPI001F17A550|nr:hypothetical protein [Microvirgula aerodenitrificans]